MRRIFLVNLMVGAVTLALPLSAQASTDSYAVTDVHVTPVLATFPYHPVQEGSDSEGDASDCTINGHEIYEPSATLAAGCGGFDLDATYTVSRDDTVPGASATVTRVYGCINPNNGNKRVRIRRTGPALFYLASGTYFLPSGTPTSRRWADVAPLEKFTCHHRHRKPAQLRQTMTDLVIYVYPDNGDPTPLASFPQAGTWTARF